MPKTTPRSSMREPDPRPEKLGSRQRASYSQEFKVQVVAFSLRLPANARVKPTCRAFPGIEPVQIRKWTRSLGHIALAAARAPPGSLLTGRAPSRRHRGHPQPLAYSAEEMMSPGATSEDEQSGDEDTTSLMHSVASTSPSPGSSSPTVAAYEDASTHSTPYFMGQKLFGPYSSTLHQRREIASAPHVMEPTMMAQQAQAPFAAMLAHHPQMAVMGPYSRPTPAVCPAVLPVPCWSFATTPLSLSVEAVAAHELLTLSQGVRAN